MSATPEQIETALVKAVGDAIRDHTIANMEWGPLGYDGIAKEIIGMVRIFSTTNAALIRAQAERVRVLESVFGHYHVGPGDKCGQCGLDLRDRVHTRAVQS